MKKKLFVCLLIIVSLLITKNVYAETYDGEYNIEYLLKNYSVVTLGQKENMTYNWDNRFNKGDLGITNYYYSYTVNIEGATMVSGKAYNLGSFSSLNIGSNAGSIKSFFKGNIGNGVTILSQRTTDPNYIDFKRLYEEVIKESQAIADNTEYYINSAKFEVSKPGIYTVQNTANLTRMTGARDRNNTLLIKNYDKNSLYIFNYYNEYLAYSTLPGIKIMESGSQNAVYLSDYINSRNYTGNIIFNFPNAKEINLRYEDYYGNDIYCQTSEKCEGFNGNIIAPNAYIFIDRYFDDNFYGSIISNSLNVGKNIKKANYTLDKRIIEPNNYIVNAKDNPDDYYSRDYSIKDLLENYSLVTLGHKTISSKSKLANLTNRNGSVRLFHITGQALINGDMVYDTPGFVSAFDLQSNKVTESYINGYSFLSGSDFYSGQGGGYSVIQPWDNMNNDNIAYYYQKNSLIAHSPYTQSEYNYLARVNFLGIITAFLNNGINFDRLYNNVVAEQKGIEEGTTLSVGSNGILHIPIGGNYTIKDISNVQEIVFDDFEKNKDELTIITIKNDGDINFPLISKNENMDKAIVTNDYFGKEKATHLYELNTFLSEDSYYGNIVWNLPNAGYIKLAENAPFAGHLIAPNADAETPELHFAGCFIVNSIYGEGNTEAHFYPIRSDLKCVSSEYDSLSKTQKMRFNDYRLRKSLGGDNSTIEKEIIGDKAQYDKDVALFESLILKCDNREIIVNPKTAGTIAIILGLLTIGSITLIATRKANKSN
ncbi:MAG: choice-of-anchor A family protein [Bacilli bacterium]|nr:choice-of-anchor A family protein [Bacilli bacterium]